jgi:hypothetical protein
VSLKFKVLFWFLGAAMQSAFLAASPQSEVVVTYFSGPSGGIGSRDGRGTDARFYGPSGIWADAQNVYVADANNYTIRRISTATSQVTTIAGSPQQSGDSDGIGSAARFHLLGSLWGDGVNLYVNDGCRIRRVVIATGEVTPFAGTSLTDCQTVDGPADVASFKYNGPLWGDGAYLYYVDPAVTGLRFSPNLPGTLRIISLATGDTRSVPLPLILTAGGSVSPRGIWGKDGYLYMTWFSSAGFLTMSRINVITGQLEWLFNVHPPGVSGFLPVGLWFDGNDNFYYIENNVVRRFALSTGATASIATLPATFSGPSELTGSGDDLYVSDQRGEMVTRIHIPTAQVTVFAGLPSTTPHTPQDNVTPQSGFFHGVWSDGKSLYVTRDGDILKIDPATNSATVFATGFQSLGGVWGDGAFLYVVNTDKEEVDQVSLSTGQSTTLATGFGAPSRIWGDSTYLYVTGDNAVRRVTKASGEVTVFAGSPLKVGSVDGIGTDARFSGPSGIWGDSTYLYVADNRVRRIRLSTAEVTTMAVSAPLPEMFGMAGDGTNLYVVVNGLSPLGGSVVKIVIATGEAITLAQITGSPVWADNQSVYIVRNFTAPALDKITIAANQLSRVYPPLQFSDGVVPADQIAVDVRWSDGQFLYGMFGAAIYKVRISDGTIFHVAGVFEEAGLVDGVGNHVRFGNPNDLWGDGTYLYVVGDGRIRRVKIATQEVDTMVGGFVPNRIWGDGQGNLYLSDPYYRSIEKTSIAAPAIVPIAGSQGQPLASDFADGVGTAARFSAIGAMWGDGKDLFIADGCSVRRMAIATLVVTTFVGVPNSCSHLDGSAGIARFNTINDTWGNNGVLYVASPHTIRAVDLTTGDTHTIAGDPVLIGTEDGSGRDARFVGPKRVVSDGLSLYVSDNGIRKISFAVSTLPFALSANGGSYWTTGSSNSALTTGYMELIAAAGNANPQGVAVFSYRSNGVLVSEAAVPASPEVQSGRVYADIGGNVKTGIAIANPNDSAATITFYFTDANGTNFGNGTTAIGPNQQISGFLDNAPWNGSADARSFTFASSVPVGAIALRGFVNERSDFLMTTLPVVPLALPAVPQVVLPHFATGGGWVTEILLVNPTDRVLNGSVLMDSTYSYSVAPRSTAKVVTSSQASTITTGTVQIVPAVLSSPPAATSVFSLTAGGVAVTQTGAAANDLAQTFRLLAESDATHAMQTGVAIANASSSAASIQLQLFDLSGQFAGFSGSTTVPANGHLAAFLGELPGLQNLPASFRGILQVTSSVPITMIGLRIRYNERGDLLMSTTPALADSAANSETTLLFPHIAVGGGYSTEFILLSPATAAGTAVIRSQSGADLPLPLVR